ncbi:hypothetical protein NQZ68_020834, partial [Dissostichus eleginoides]
MAPIEPHFLLRQREDHAGLSPPSSLFLLWSSLRLLLTLWRLELQSGGKSISMAGDTRSSLGQRSIMAASGQEQHGQTQCDSWTYKRVTIDFALNSCKVKGREAVAQWI